MEKTNSQRAEGSFLGNTVTSKHFGDSSLYCECKSLPVGLPYVDLLQSKGLPETTIKSMGRCGSLMQRAHTDGSMGFLWGFKQCNCAENTKAFVFRYQCNNRTCPSCAEKRKRKLRRKYLPFLKNIHNQPFSERRFKIRHLVISPQNYDNFEEGQKEIKIYFKKFLRRQYVKDRVKGGFFNIEATNKYDNGFNVHMHILYYGARLDNQIRGKCFDCGQNLMKFDHILYEETGKKNYFCANKNCNSTHVMFNQDSKIVSEWKKSTEGQHVNMHVEDVKSTGFSLNYLLKYVTSHKDSFKTMDSLADFVVGIRGKKLISPFGCFYNQKFIDYKCTCPVCLGEIQYSFDYIVSNLLNTPEHDPVPPDNQTLSVFINPPQNEKNSMTIQGYDLRSGSCPYIGCYRFFSF